MNYLAHAFLSNNDKDLLIGNFIADHLRGNDFSLYSPGIIKGIYLHRRIDSFTDAHPMFKASKRLFYDGFEKHSGILVDIYYDHLLGKNFETLSHENLKDFSGKVYTVYSDHKHLMPEGSNRFLEYVIKNDIYTSYGSLEGIERVLYHLSHRIKHNVKLDQSVGIFREKEPELKDHFSSFFKDALREFLPE